VKIGSGGKGQNLQRRTSLPNKVWCWDITWLPKTIKGEFYYAYVIIDIFDRSIVGWAVHEKESEIHSRDLFETLSRGRNIVFKCLHSDNGAPMRGSSLLAFLSSMDVKVSFSRPRTSNDNPFIESLFRTLKYNAKYPLRFKDIEHVREWIADFVNWYNTQHLHSAIGYVTPEQMRSGKAMEIFRKRRECGKSESKRILKCWGKRKPHIWQYTGEVILNPEKR